MADRPAETDTKETPASVAQASGQVRAVGEASTSQMVFDLQNSVGEVKDAVAALSRAFERGFGRLDAVERSASDIKDVLRSLAPKVDDLAGFAKHRAPSLIDTSDLEVVQSRLLLEIQKRPTRRQAVFDIAWIVGLITAAITFGAKFGR